MPLDLAGILAAGVLTFGSPCVLPLVPVYLGLLGGASAAELRGGPPARLLLRTVAFALGLVTVFVALGLAASGIGQLLVAHRPQLLVVSGVVMIAFGLRFLGVLHLPLADREGRPWLRRLRPGRSLLGAFLFGAAFALGWTPCVGPVLGSVLTYTALTSANPARGALYLGTYAMGLTLPLVAAAAFAPRILSVLDRIRPHLRKLEIATGFLLIVVGGLLATDRLMSLMPGGTAANEVLTASVNPGPPSPELRPSPPGPDGRACSPESTVGSACDVAPPAAPSTSPGPARQAFPGPAVVEVMSQHCPICRLMEPVVAEAEQGCASKVVRVFVEDPPGAALVRRHAVRGVPTFLLLDSSGGEVGRLVGQQTTAAVRDALWRASPELCQAAPRDRAEVPN